MKNFHNCSLPGPEFYEMAMNHYRASLTDPLFVVTSDDLPPRPAPPIPPPRCRLLRSRDGGGRHGAPGSLLPLHHDRGFLRVLVLVPGRWARRVSSY
ncbi:hypothetical protein O3P69_010448 [Scylla paramamosain]|uniref:Uncharacterized protein n=1 Tax=Scylla paramamosain TaxID=85552 RepID=A0AAW0TVQ0_SCYPA